MQKALKEAGLVHDGDISRAKKQAIADVEEAHKRVDELEDLKGQLRHARSALEDDTRAYNHALERYHDLRRQGSRAVGHWQGRVQEHRQQRKERKSEIYRLQAEVADLEKLILKANTRRTKT